VYIAATYHDSFPTLQLFQCRLKRTSKRCWTSCAQRAVVLLLRLPDAVDWFHWFGGGIPYWFMHVLLKLSLTERGHWLFESVNM